ncbi:UNVERIFIED_CONTAM: hypothetical protein HDU68_011828 [Siphonaria sp. JEL0065]|nr:hypothetical protein HDU68_011828 [Siphonaria sp. JEL0065]
MSQNLKAQTDSPAFKSFVFAVFLVLVFTFRFVAEFEGSEPLKLQSSKRWTEMEVNEWYSRQPWLVGSNFLPSTASNQLEMFQEDTFDLDTIDKELGLANSIGMNTMRVFLHDLLYRDDRDGFFERLDLFLDACSKHGIRPLLVFFDSCWDGHPKSGKQEEPIPGVHNSRWVMSPGLDALNDPGIKKRLEDYVRHVIRRYRTDERILGWDIWNEPDNKRTPDEMDVIHELLPAAFRWAREEGATQPLTSGVWTNYTHFNEFQKMQACSLIIELSDVISFHHYKNLTLFEAVLNQMQSYSRPVFVTEWLMRPNSLPQEYLPITKKNKVAMFNWGFVTGRMQTRFSYNATAEDLHGEEPDEWFHDLFYADGTPYRVEEIDLFKQLLL